MHNSHDDKNETTRFLGDGVSFKAKLIGILEVSEARGDRMCQEALSDLKMAIRAAGEHKQRITVNIAIDGLRLRDEKTGDSLYHHPVHKISFIAQDMADSRAFGYIFGSPDTGHRFFGIKTDKAASQVVIAMRDLFQVVFALKKKEIELAKQHLDKNRFNHSPMFSDGANSNLKNTNEETAKHSASEGKTGSSSTENKSSGTAVADLVDLELELSSLQQGLHQMERITPSDPFASKDDPFGDSFISYPQKPILPPPPSSGRERSTRISESSSVSSPKTPHIANKNNSVDTTLYNTKSSKHDDFSRTFAGAQEGTNPTDWFSTPPGSSIFEERTIVPEPTKDEKHEIAKKEILSQFDVFTELDPLELKNPPKKVLNDLVSQPQDLTKSLISNIKQSTEGVSSITSAGSLDNSFTTDPFGEDPFVKEDPFATEDFTKQDPFETEFKIKESKITANEFEDPVKENSTFIYNSSLTPKATSKTVQFNNRFDDLSNKSQENLSLDMSSESECAPEPPPRPSVGLMKIKPPPLPPKKHDLVKPLPPLPPHTEAPHYDFLDNYDSALSFIKSVDKDKPPSLPMPARKSKFESALTSVPDRQKKQFHLQQSKEDDYLTPIDLPESKNTEYILLPPPQKNLKNQPQHDVKVTVASLLESQPNLTVSRNENPSNELNGLDISLSQLTLADLNELAAKLNIPASQFSNMTLVQLTSFLSNIMKNKSMKTTTNVQSESKSDTATFDADFDSNFGSTNSYDRYAVFRELIQEEIKQTKIDNDPQEEENLEPDTACENVTQNSVSATDRYAALREIAETELNKNIVEQFEDNNKNETDQDSSNQEKEETNGINEDVQNINVINYEHKAPSESKEIMSNNDNFIEYGTSLDNQKDVPMQLKSPKSPINNKVVPVKSPVPIAITEIMQSNTRLTSGSLSDVISGSSPEVDNTASNSEVVQKPNDAAGESWAIFDQENLPSATLKDKQVQSEEGVSPWSSDSKEFGNVSPLEWRQRMDSGSGGDQWFQRRSRREQEGWWDTSAEPVAETYPNHRSFDSYEEEYYESYDRPRRRKQQSGRGSQNTGGHSSSSRDVSPWEEEPRTRDLREIRGEPRSNWARHSRPAFERDQENRPTDSDWDDEEDYEYEDEHSERFRWNDRYGNRDFERHSSCGREHGDRWGDDWSEDRRHRRRRDDRDRWCCSDWEQMEHETPLNRFGSGRRPPPESISGKRRERNHEDRPADRYYARESQESPWEDDYSNDVEEPHSLHYMSGRRNWKRPSSASEMDRKTGEIKSKYYFGSGGSDGERERRYKGSRRSRSKDSQIMEPSYRHKPEGNFPVRNPHRSKQHQHLKPQFDNNFPNVSSKKQIDSKLDVNKKTSTLTNKKKSKDVYKTEESIHGSLPRKPCRTKPFFENDFLPNEENISGGRPSKFSFENDFETSEADSPTVTKSHKYVKHKVLDPVSQFPLRQPRSFRDTKSQSHFQSTSKSLFEDDFSPSDKEQIPEDSISSIKEEVSPVQNEDSFDQNSFESTTNSRRKILNKNRLSGSIRSDFNIKKSESVNIFKREDDPFDDDFFCEESSGVHIGNFKEPTKDTELKWTENFDDFDVNKEK